MCEGGIDNQSLGIIVCNHSASLVMPIGDPHDGFFYPNLTLMTDSYILTDVMKTPAAVNGVKP